MAEQTVIRERTVIAERTVQRYYVYAFLGGLQFTWTTWLAFVIARQGNPGWAEAAYHLAILFGEVPTGIVADLFGRRTSMLVGLLLGAASSVSYLWIHGTPSAMAVLAFSGLAGTFLSGADTALLYEAAARTWPAAQSAAPRPCSWRLSGSGPRWPGCCINGIAAPPLSAAPSCAW